MTDWESLKAVLSREEWEAIERQSAYMGIEPRDYLSYIIIGGRVVPISMLEQLIRDDAERMDDA